MSKVVHVVDGEASESDSEIEIGKSPTVDVPSTDVFVVAGEAPESDDESKLTAPRLSDLDAPLHVPFQGPTGNSRLPSSLLHQKLWECNISLRATLEGLVKHTTDIAVEKLTTADKILLHGQESMRSANANLTLARARLKQIHAELENANCSSALPTVKIK
ncbi:hypothetical protein MSG28_014479 [Choristoneura fumiferana]|uniref:Uncharacterized protein n=1 Tax=Choristoneura fumiferana TaxID=7141 RepID=A0ACC0JS00_CHOFU|nr:hypothetical protein MSG28_014479 [Choristoneura fumiferana]